MVIPSSKNTQKQAPMWCGSGVRKGKNSTQTTKLFKTYLNWNTNKPIAKITLHQLTANLIGMVGESVFIWPVWVANPAHSTGYPIYIQQLPTKIAGIMASLSAT